VERDSFGAGPIRYTYVGSPVGDILVAGDDAGLRLITLPLGTERQKPGDSWLEDKRPFRDAARQLVEYFDGTRRTFDLQLAIAGTAFQKTAWRALLDVPYGETVSYLELACRIGRPTASRAVGSANAANPLSIVVPCHRVVGTTGALTGYAGGLRAKEFLLRLEGAFPPQPKCPPAGRR